MDVYNKQLWASNAKLINYYMFYGYVWVVLSCQVIVRLMNSFVGLSEERHGGQFLFLVYTPLMIMPQPYVLDLLVSPLLVLTSDYIDS